MGPAPAARTDGSHGVVGGGGHRQSESERESEREKEKERKKERKRKRERVTERERERGREEEGMMVSICNEHTFQHDVAPLLPRMKGATLASLRGGCFL